MTTQTTALRNRVYRDLACDRLAYAETHDATHRDGERYVWRDDPRRAAYADIPMRHPEGEPASGRQTAAIVGTCICGVLLLVGLAYLVWAGSHGGSPWTK
jgi:hypothetical protein